MALIADSKGRRDGESGFGRLLGNAAVGELLSKVHAAVIRTGLELEVLLKEEISPERLVPLDEILVRLAVGQMALLPDWSVVFKGKMMSRIVKRCGHADIVYFDHQQQIAIVIELKDGDNFDTKKSDGEWAGLEKFSVWLEEQTFYKVGWALCCFNQSDPAAICRGLKGRFDCEHVLTGERLCELLGVGYSTILRLRQKHQEANRRYIVERLLSIEEMRDQIVKAL